MNKYLTGLVAVATAASMGATSIPASAATLDDVRAAISNAMNGIEYIRHSTTADDIKQLYANEIANTGFDTHVDVTFTTPGASAIFIDILTTPAGATVDSLSFVKAVTTSASVSASDFTFDESTGTIIKYNGSSTDLVIPNEINGVPVRSIEMYAFRDCVDLTNITLPDSVTNIGRSAFSGCRYLRSINIPNGVTSIAESAFNHCESLTSITIPNSVTSIGNNAFTACASLTGITIPSSVTSIGEYAFCDCHGLTTITLPDSVTSMGKYAFADCSNVSSIRIPSSLTDIKEATFMYCTGLTSLTIPNSVVNIGRNAFGYCEGLTSINIPNTVTSIGESAFGHCSGLTSVTIPNSVTSVGNNVFENCSGLTSVTISDGVSNISNNEFYGCSSLTNIAIPRSVINIGDQAFGNCSNLREISVANENDKYKSINGVLFNKEGNQIIQYPIGKIEESYIIPNGVTYIGWSSFANCSNLKSITIPNTVTGIGWSAFANCSNLTSLTIPDSVTSIEYNVFRDCSNLTSVTIPNSVISIGDYAFNHCENAKFYVKSERVKEILLNIGIDESKITVDSEEQDDMDPALEVAWKGSEIFLKEYNYTNATTQNDVENYIVSKVNNPAIRVTVTDFSVVPSTDSTDGYCKFTATFTNAEGEDADNHFNTKIPKSMDSAINVVGKASEIFLKEYNYTNATTQKDVENYIVSKVNNPEITVTVTDFKLIPSTDSTDGYCQFTATFTNAKGEHADNHFGINIQNIMDPALEAAWKGSEIFLKEYNYTNSTTQKDVEDYIVSKVNNPAIKVVVTNFKVIPATYSTEGDCKFKVQFINADGEDAYNDFGKFIPKLSATNTTHSSSSSHHSSSSSSSSSGSSSSSSSSSSSTATTGTNTNTNTTTATTGTRPVSLANITKETAKAIEAQVINNVNKVLGEGVSTGQAKEIQALDGNKLTVTSIVKDGKSVGAVISAEASSAIATIPVNTEAGAVKAVYKYVPLLGKYIQLTDGVVIGTDSITLPTQANATYVAATTAMPSTETVTAGWVKADNNWYKVNTNGEPQTGWQNDGTGWTYLSTDNGAMQVGWKNDGGTWYYLKDTGYMATGWVKAGDKWYYLNQNGSMAANAVIDGYQLDNSGAWVG